MHPLEAELVEVIRHHITRQPRTLQTRIGPSEVGIPCDRRIGYKLAEVPEVNVRDVAWKPFVGTALHSEFAMIFELDATANHDSGRWLLEQKVNTGTINGVDIDGSTDLFDTVTGTVVDWKFTTRNKLKGYRSKGPGEQYRAQAHDYGRGWAERGHNVTEVAVFFFTRDGEFTDRYFWSEPFDPTVAEAAYDRATGIAQLVEALGPDAGLPLLPTADAYCTYCPWQRPGSTDLAVACPGDPNSRTAHQPPGSLADALGTN